jgi:hypothetical protein
MAKPPAPRVAAANPDSRSRAGKKPRSGKRDASALTPLPLYSVFLLGAFAMRPGPARGGK